MSVKTAMNSRVGGSKALVDVNQDVIWQRPTDWLTLDTLGPSDQKVIGLFAVFNNDTNYVAFTATGNYTVNWGDGTSENVNTGVKAQHKYNWADISSGTLTSEGFRQAIITITPQAGQSLATITFQAVHSSTTAGSGNGTAWLELKVALTTSFTLSNYASIQTIFPYLKILSIDNYGSSLTTTMLRGCSEGIKQVFINKALSISSSGPFQNAYGLEYLYINPECSAADCSNLFLNCSSLKNAPYINTTGVLNFSTMFSGCSSLRNVPLYNTSSVTNMSSMFLNCRVLETIPLYNTSSVTNMSSMFLNCYSLKLVPLLNMASVTDCNSMFSACVSLETIPSFILTSASNISSMFLNCYSLKTIPVLSLKTTGTVNITSIFNGCYSLEYIPEIFTNSTLVDPSSVFNNCYSLKAIPSMPLLSGTTADIGSGLYELSEIGAINLSGITSGFSVLTSQMPLRRCRIYGSKFLQSYASKMLDKFAIDEIISNLGNGATATRALTITGNPGANVYPTLSRSSTTTTGSTTISVSDTSSFVNNMQVTGTGISDARSVTFQDSGDTVTLVGHGIPNGKLVSFTAITSTTGIVIYTTYYVINATTDTFQLSLTQGGSAIALTTDGSGTMLYQTLVTNIVTNTSVTIDIPASASGTVTLAYRNLNTQIAVMRRFSVTG